MEKKTSFVYLQSLSQGGGERLKSLNSETFFLAVVIGDHEIYFPIEYVDKVVAGLPISGMGHSQPWFKGVARVDGEIYGVINIDSLVSPKRKRRNSAESSVVTLTNVDGYYGVSVETVIGVVGLNLPKMQSESGCLKKYKGRDNVEYKVLSVQKLLDSKVFKEFSIF